jgi:hypothetical protein
MKMEWPVAMHVHAVTDQDREETPSEHQPEKNGGW